MNCFILNRRWLQIYIAPKAVIKDDIGKYKKMQRCHYHKEKYSFSLNATAVATTAQNGSNKKCISSATRVAFVILKTLSGTLHFPLRICPCPK